MRLKLDIDDGLRFSTLSNPTLGSYRTLMVKVNGKAFSVWMTMDEHRALYLRDDRHYMEEVDAALVAAMEKMLTKLFNDACAAVPVGTELLKP